MCENIILTKMNIFGKVQKISESTPWDIHLDIILLQMSGGLVTLLECLKRLHY